MTNNHLHHQGNQQNCRQTLCNHDTISAEQVFVNLPDLAQTERVLIPLLNQVRKLQGKKPVIVPK